MNAKFIREIYVKAQQIGLYSDEIVQEGKIP